MKHIKKQLGSRTKVQTSHGFTMVELLVVVTIIGIVLVLAVPNFAGMQNRARIRSGAQEVAQDFRHIRERALSLSQTFTVTSPTQNTYRVTNPSGTAYDYKLGNTTGGALRFGTGPGVVGTPPEDQDGMAGAFDFIGGLVIQSRGACTPGVAYITNGHESYAVGVNRLGKVRVYQFKNGMWGSF